MLSGQLDIPAWNIEDRFGREVETEITNTDMAFRMRGNDRAMDLGSANTLRSWLSNWCSLYPPPAMHWGPVSYIHRLILLSALLQYSGAHWLLLWMAAPCGGLRNLRSQRQMEWYWCFCEYKRVHQRSADWIPKFSYWKLSILPLQHPWDKHHDYLRTVPSLTLWPCASVCTLFLKWFLSQEVLHASLEQRLGKSNASVHQIGIASSSEALGFYSKLTLDSASSESISCISYRSPGLQYAIHGIYCKIRETSIFWCVTSVFSETLFDH